MRTLAIAFLSFCILSLAPSADAARKLRQAQPIDQDLRLVVITAPGCVYCRLFRQDIAPTYESSKHGSKVPLVYIDVNEEAANALALKGPIQVVPTIVLVDGNREISRINGFIGRSNFFMAFKHMLARY